MKNTVIRRLAAVVAVLFFIGMTGFGQLSNAIAESQAKVQVNGKEVKFTIAPQIVKERMVVPAKEFAAALGLKDSFIEEFGLYSLENSKAKINMPLDSRNVTINGNPADIEVTSRITNGSIMVPLRFVCENLGYKISWDSISFTANITASTDTALKDFKIPASVAKGVFPDIAVDSLGNIHIVYARYHYVYYRMYDAKSGKWGEEQATGIWGKSGNLLPDMGFYEERSEPDIVIDSKNRPHVFAGSEYAYLDGTEWKKIKPVANPEDPSRGFRDTELAIDSKDNIYMIHRAGHNGGNMGLYKLVPGAAEWQILPDPDLPVDPKQTNHVYPDFAIDPKDDSIHIVLRHALPLKVSYRVSRDGGNTWTAEGIWDKPEPESPHIAVDYNSNVYVTNGNGDFFKRTDAGWVQEGTAVRTPERTQPELAVDRQNNLYCMPWGGTFNVRDSKGVWVGEKQIIPSYASKVGFVETAGGQNSVYAVWEEAESVEADMGAGLADIVVGVIKPDGTVTGIQK